MGAIAGDEEKRNAHDDERARGARHVLATHTTKIRKLTKERMTMKSGLRFRMRQMKKGTQNARAAN